MADKPALTPAEHFALELTTQLWDTLSQDVVATGESCDQDLREFAFHIHAIQSRLMGQAAARAYPNLYRLLGDTLLPDRS